MQQRLTAGRDGTVLPDSIEDHCLILPAELQVCVYIGEIEVQFSIVSAQLRRAMTWAFL
jgi:hypothetical protein